VADVLIASDSPAVVDEVVSALDEPGTTIRVVRAGIDVLPAALDRLPDLVVLDQQIGNMGSMACSLNLRLEESGDRLDPVSILVLLDRRADVFLARRSGADGWVMKPLDPIRLRRAARLLLDGATYEDETGRPEDIVADRAAGDAAPVG
jgi:DNA-binding response OmpR family regulator